MYGWSSNPFRPAGGSGTRVLAAMATYVVVAMICVWSRALIVNDGAAYILAVWSGAPWDLYLFNNAERTFSYLVWFGPLMALLSIANMRLETFTTCFHICNSQGGCGVSPICHGSVENSSGETIAVAAVVRT